MQQLNIYQKEKYQTSYKRQQSISKEQENMKQKSEKFKCISNSQVNKLKNINTGFDISKINFIQKGILGTVILIFLLCIINVIQMYTPLLSENFPFYIYNKNLSGQTFGNFTQLYLNFSEIYIKWNNNNMNQFSSFVEKPFYYYRIQVGSVLDFGLTQLINFDEIQKIFYQKLAFQLTFFEFKSSLQKQATFIQSHYFSNNSQIQYFLDQLVKNSKARENTIEYNLGIQLVKNQNDNRLLQVEYYLANKKYNIGSQSQQKRICIYSAGMNIMSKKDRYLKYFQQMQNLNYTNFHIIYIDDFSEDGSFQRVYQYLKNSSLRIRNRIKIVHNLQRLGVLPNMYLWVKKYCNSDDIVVVIDADDKVIGRQSLKIINSIYQSPNVWYAYSKYILTCADQNDQDKDYQKDFQRGYSSNFMKYRTQEYRISFDWSTSLMRSFRKKLLDSVPLYSLIQYHYQQELGIGWPSFYKYGADMFMVHAQLQIAGNHRIAHFQDYLYLYFFVDYVHKDCHREQQIYDGYKSKIKTPLTIVTYLGQKSRMMRNYNISQQKLKIIQQSFNQSRQCNEKFYKSSLGKRR